MDYNRTQLNSLIFHNQIVLPRTSSGFGEVSLAVAELQGGNYEKAAILAEIAVGKDPSLAAGWLAKMAADVYEATPDDLRKERAVFCLDRAFACAPSCRTDMVEFFLTHILAHYVQVLCEGAVEELGEWMQLEAHADHLDARAQSLHFRAAQTHGNASLLEAAGLVAGLIAVFSRRLGTQVFGGVASVAAFSEAALQRRDAALLDMQAQDLSAAASDLRLQGSEHRLASMLHLVPARDLIELGNRVAHAEGLSPQLLDPTVQGFVATFRQVGEGHLGWLRRQLLSPVWDAIDGQRSGLEKTYVAVSAELTQISRRGPVHMKVSPREPHPLTRSTLLWLEHMVPGATKLAEYRLLAFPLPTVRREGAVGGRAKKDREVRTAAAVYAAICGVVCFVGVRASGGSGWVLGSGALTGVLAVGSLWFHGRVAKRERLRTLFSSALRIDTWVQPPIVSTPPPGGPAAVAGLLPAAQAGPGKRKGLLGWLGKLACLGCAGMMALVALIILVAIFGHHHESAPTGAATPSQTVAPTRTPTGTPANMATPAPVRRAIPVSVATPPSASPATSPSSPSAAAASTPATVLYEVTGIAAGDTLNVRNGPGATHEISARLPGGYRDIQVIGAPVFNGPTPWVQIRFGERTGWVTRSFLKPE